MTKNEWCDIQTDEKKQRFRILLFILRTWGDVAVSIHEWKIKEGCIVTHYLKNNFIFNQFSVRLGLLHKNWHFWENHPQNNVRVVSIHSHRLIFFYFGQLRPYSNPLYDSVLAHCTTMFQPTVRQCSSSLYYSVLAHCAVHCHGISAWVKPA